MIKKRRIFFFLVSFIIIFFLFYFFVYTNFHTVLKEKVYRSKQLNKQELSYYIEKYNIKSILNLRGEHNKDKWYKDEISICSQMNIVHQDYGLSASHYYSAVKINQMLSILSNLPKPTLIHCKAGADRTSLLSAVYLYAIAHKSYKEAKKQLSLKYGHFPYFGNDTVNMDKSFSNYVKSKAVKIQ